MDGNLEWVDMRSRKPTEADGDHAGCVLVWHMHNGCMVYHYKNAAESEMIVAWMRTPGAPELV